MAKSFTGLLDEGLQNNVETTILGTALELTHRDSKKDGR